MATETGTAPGPSGPAFDRKPGPKRTLEQGWAIKLCGAGLVLGLVGVVAVSLVMFSGGFQNTVKVTVDAPRAGLVMDKDAKVKMRGVEIGHVASISNTANGGARIELALDPDKLKLVPANSSVDIRSTTVFGAKYVNFIEPQQPSKDSLQPGSTVQADAVTVEFNTIFEHLNDVLAKVQPDKLNATLTALGTALQGRGDKLGQALSDADVWLRQINPDLPILQTDLQKTTAVTGTYSDTVPDLLQTTDNAVVTGKTIVDEQNSLDAMLTNLIGLADTTTPTLNETEPPLTQALAYLKPTTGILNEYRSAIYCTIVGIGSNMPLVGDIFGGRYPAVTMNASIMPGGTPYQYPQDLPKVNATGGPHCEGVLDHKPGTNADYLMTDTSQGEVWHPETNPHLNANVFQLLYAGMPGVPGVGK